MIYPTSTSAKESARALDDKRLKAAVQFSAEVIVSVLHTRKYPNLPYPPLKSPWVNWAKDEYNFGWVLCYHRECTVEYTRRTGKPHKAWQAVGKRFADVIPHGRLLKDVLRLDFDRDLGVDYTDISDAYLGYRLLLNAHWLNESPQWYERIDPPSYYKLYSKYKSTRLWAVDDMPSWRTPDLGLSLLTKQLLKSLKKPAPSKGFTRCPRCGNSLRWQITKDHKKTVECELNHEVQFTQPIRCINWYEV